MRKIALETTLVSLILTLLSACGGGSQPAASTVEDYIRALVAKDANRLSTLSCADWESTALTELDSFQAVQIRLEGLACSVSGSDGGTALVTCKGKIIASYNNEDQTIDLSVRTYQVVQQEGNYLVCGYR
jgi:hypothetical protein